MKKYYLIALIVLMIVMGVALAVVGAHSDRECLDNGGHMVIGSHISSWCEN